MTSTIGKAADVPRGDMTAFDVAGERVTVANVDGEFFGFSDFCTHLGCLLSEGPLAGAVVTCPCHGSQFDVTTGAVVTGPAAVPLKTFAVRLTGDELEVLTEEDAAPAAEPAREDARQETRPAPAALTNVALFAGLDPEALESLEAFTFRRTFRPGELIVEEGRTGNGLYVVLSGRVEVVKGLDGGRPQVVAALGPGEPFGEMALLGEWPRSASVRAVEETECLGMDRWAFLAHLQREPRLAIKMLQIMARRLADAGAKLAE